MALNCKPGDLAVYVGKDISQHGRIVTCVQLFSPRMPVWITNPSLPLVDGGGPSLGIWDSALRPIRPQGDDAQDESKAWLPPVPTKEHA